MTIFCGALAFLTDEGREKDGNDERNYQMRNAYTAILKDEAAAMAEALYAHIETHESIRVLIVCSAGERKTFIDGADIDNAYLHGNLDISIIMEQPTDSSQHLARPGYVCEFIRTLYGTRQECKICCSHPGKTLKQWGCNVSSIDNRVYFLLECGEFLMLAIVVEHIALLSNSPNLIKGLNLSYLAHSQLSCSVYSSLLLDGRSTLPIISSK